MAPSRHHKVGPGQGLTFLASHMGTIVELDGFSRLELPDHGWHATHDNDIGLGQVRSQRLRSHDYRTCVKDIIQQEL